MHGADYQVKGSNELVIFILLSFFPLALIFWGKVGKQKEEQTKPENQSYFASPCNFPIICFTQPLGKGTADAAAAAEDEEEEAVGERERESGPFLG